MIYFSSYFCSSSCYLKYNSMKTTISLIFMSSVARISDIFRYTKRLVWKCRRQFVFEKIQFFPRNSFKQKIELSSHAQKPGCKPISTFLFKADYSAFNCNVTDAAHDKWSFLIVEEIIWYSTRISRFERLCDSDITKTLLSSSAWFSPCLLKAFTKKLMQKQQGIELYRTKYSMRRWDTRIGFVDNAVVVMRQIFKLAFAEIKVQSSITVLLYFLRNFLQASRS